MNRTRVLLEIRQMRFAEAYEGWRGGRLTQEAAAELLGVSDRTFRRFSRRFEEEGHDGLLDRRMGQVSAKLAPVDEVMALSSLYRSRYSDWAVKHFFDFYQAEHRGTRSYTWVKNSLQQQGVVVRAKRRGAHRRKRERRPLPGMMLHQDGSRHEWLAGTVCDLVITMDDATSEIYSALLVAEEGTMSSFLGVQAVVKQKGLFSSLYTDRGSHYWLTPKAGAKVDRQQPTQFHRALKQLGIELIPAYSPQARGRSERSFKTWQERLPRELVLAGITSVAAANKYIQRRFLPAFNRQFSLPAREPGSAFVPFIGDHLQEVLCVQEARVVGNDNCVRYRNLTLQISADEHRCHYVKANVRVHEYPDATLAVFHGPRCLARYSAQGKPLKAKQRRAA
jgi:transposase